MAAIRSNTQKISQYIWLIGGVLFLIAAFIFWIMTDTQKLVMAENPIEETQVQIQPEKVAATAHLGNLMDEVRPLEMTARVVSSGEHLAEFKGTGFFEKNKKNYMIELFKANEEGVINGFLQRQASRKNFIYFRLSGENQTEQYVLAYGVYPNESDANVQLQQLKLALPASVKPQVVKFSKYAESINDLGSDEMQGSNKLYEVKLKTAALPVIDETVLAQRAQAATTTTSTAPAIPTTRTTITRKDSSGNVVGVERSQSSADTPVRPKEPAKTVTEPKAPSHEISDPFN